MADNSTSKRVFDRQSEDKANLMRQRDYELQKGRELQAVLYDLDAKNQNRDDQIAVTRKELDDVKFSNSSLDDRNQDL